jgi:hypothetical protein
MGAIGQFHTPPVMSPVAPEEGVVQLTEVEDLARRVQEVLRHCNDKLNTSRAGLQDLTYQRSGFAQHLREAEQDFFKMGLDWQSIEDELKHVRETLIKEANLSERDQARLLDSLAVESTARKARPHDNLGDENGDPDPSSIAAILSAAAEGADPQAIVKASEGRSPRSMSPLAVGSSLSPNGFGARHPNVESDVQVALNADSLEKQLERLESRGALDRESELRDRGIRPRSRTFAH